MRVLGIKIESLVDPLETKMSEKSNGWSSKAKKSDKKFSQKMRISRTTINLLLNSLWDELVLTPTNVVPEATSPERQLAASLYRLAPGVTYTVFEDVFGISKDSGCVFFNKVIRLIVTYFYNEYVKLHETDGQ